MAAGQFLFFYLTYDTEMNEIPRLIALYLPQYHPIPENNQWWGNGFTEWTNVTKAKKLFPGHHQPNLPADLGFYDLRVPEVRNQQAALAKEYGIEGFCYYHYWFGGRRIIERPFNEVLSTGDPDFPFCLCWANETWSGIWHGNPKKILIEQTYPGLHDHQAHFNALLPAFRDSRYITADGKPVFLVYRPMNIPNVKDVMSLWRKMATDAGLKGLFLVASSPTPDWFPKQFGFDACIHSRMPQLRRWVSWKNPLKKIKQSFEKLRGYPTIYRYEDAIKYFLKKDGFLTEEYPIVVPNWDNTPRSGSNGLALTGSTPELFRKHLQEGIELAQQLPSGRRFVFIKSWNEWAEGNYLEPDRKFGAKYLEVIRDEINYISSQNKRMELEI